MPPHLSPDFDALYSPRVLDLARLGRRVHCDQLPEPVPPIYAGLSSSKTCGSAVKVCVQYAGDQVQTLWFQLDDADALVAVSVGIFAGGGCGLSLADLKQLDGLLVRFLHGEEVQFPVPFEHYCLLAGLRDYPQRHLSLRLPVLAVINALSSF